MPSNNSAPRTVSCVSAGGEVDTDGRLGTGALSDRMQRRSSSFEALVAAAETKQQQAERRAAVHLYDEAIALFQQALERTGEADGSATRDEVENVTILLAEALQNKCELFLKLWEAEGQRQGADPLGLLGEYSAEHEAAVGNSLQLGWERDWDRTFRVVDLGWVGCGSALCVAGSANQESRLPRDSPRRPRAAARRLWRARAVGR